MPKHRNILTLVKDLGFINGRRNGLYVCECGVKRTLIISQVNRGNNISCGCLKIRLARESKTIHGYCYHPLYAVWRDVLQRCTNKRNKNYHNYGGRGITVYKAWRDPKVFIEWALKHGWEKGLQLDRINNNKGYYPSNCRFVTRIVNLNNTRSNVNIKYNGITKTIGQWANELNIKRTTLQVRLSLGWTMKECINTPVAKKEKVSTDQVLEIFKSNKTQSQLAKIYNVSPVTIYSIKTGRNWSKITGKFNV